MKYKLASESCIIEFAFVEFIRYCQKFFQNDFTNLYLSIVAFILPLSSNGNLVLWMYYSFTIFCCHWDIYCQSNLVGICFFLLLQVLCFFCCSTKTFLGVLQNSDTWVYISCISSSKSPDSLSNLQFFQHKISVI